MMICDFPISTINLRHVKFTDLCFAGLFSLPIHAPTRTPEVQRLNLPVGLQEHPVVHAHFVRMFGLGRHQAAPGWGHHLPNGFSFNRLHLLECGAGGGICGWFFVQQKQPDTCSFGRLWY